MGKHRQEDNGFTPKAAPRESLLNTFRSNGESGGRFRNKVLATVVATGALAAIGQPMAASASQAVQPVSAPKAAAPAPAKAAPAPAPGFAKPAEGRISSGYGDRGGDSHKGIDVANSIGTPIRSVASGKVVAAGPASGFGQWVRVQHDDGIITVYGHINTIDVQNGQRVEAGQQIATLGNKGKSTGPHLHFEVIKNGEKINPMPWLAERGISLP